MTKLGLLISFAGFQKGADHLPGGLSLSQSLKALATFLVFCLKNFYKPEHLIQ